ncbi:hypothetical protein DsansV1_C13g0117431 [Dioscorea sansibarensis]
MASSKSLFAFTALLGIILILSLEVVSARDLPQQTQEKEDKAVYEAQKTYGGPGLIPGGYYGSGYLPGGGYRYLPGNGYYGPGYFPGNGYYNGYPYVPGYAGGHP